MYYIFKIFKEKDSLFPNSQVMIAPRDDKGIKEFTVCSLPSSFSQIPGGQRK